MRAINAVIMRQINRKLILDEIRRQPVSRAELSEITMLTRASVTQIIDELLAEGIVVEGDVVGRSRLGRKSTRLAINPEAKVIFGVHLSRAGCDVGAVDMRGSVLRYETLDVAGRSADDVLDEVGGILVRMRGEMGLDEKRAFGIGFCAPGPLDPNSGVILNPPNFAAWRGVAVARKLSGRTRMNVYMENNSNAHALAEKYFGCAADSFALIRVDEGVGAGVIINGRLYHGAHSFAVELGHLTVDPNGPKCDCGNHGCLETYISLPNLLAGTPYATWDALLDHLDEPLAAAAMDRLVEYFSQGIVNVLNCFDIDRVVIGDELARRPEPLLTRLNDAVRGRAIFPVAEPTVLASGDVSPVLLGAVPAYDTFFSCHSDYI